MKHTQQDDDETKALERKTVSLSPEMALRIKAGTLWAAGSTVAGCAIICTVFIVRMEGKVDSSLAGVKEISEQLKTMAPEHAILWNWYTRTASRDAAPRSQP